MVNSTRVFEIKRPETIPGAVVYWMSRDQRASDNWALLFAQETARKRNSNLAVVFCLVPEFLGAGRRQYDFMLRGLAETEKALRNKRVPFYLLKGSPIEILPPFLKEVECSDLVTDFDPMKIKRKWKKAVADAVNLNIYEVDAHNIVPCRFVSEKQEYGAYTIRPKIKRLLNDYLTDIPELEPQESTAEMPQPVDWTEVYTKIEADKSAAAVDWIKPGEAAAQTALDDFIENRLNLYQAGRNDPLRNAQSNLSPYLHFGQISAQRAALAVKRSGADEACKEAFLEELIVRRELSDNFCFYNENYDSVECFPGWAQRTLDKHLSDAREYIYTTEQFEKTTTHDPLWNAAQKEMMLTGKMHGYLRMYWAKKILEWSINPREAMNTAIYLNDKYELDGRDPNGYAGIAWSIGGVHDRPWKERGVFGSIRYMSYNGCKSKFDVDAYVKKIGKLS